MEAFVTCIYNGLYHTEYGGRNMRDARYRESLINIANTGTKIFCYTSSGNLATLKTQFARCPNIELVVKDLHTLDISPTIQEIKRSQKEKYSDLFWTQRCVEIMWGKFFMIDEVLQNHPAYDTVYWIDAGLFHNDVISPKFFLDDKPALESAGLPLFNPHLMQKLKTFLEGKLLLVQQMNPHNRPIDARYNNRPYQNHFGAVGGLFGGDAEKMKVVCASFIEKMYKLLADEELCSEEGILSAVYCDHSELFKPYVFQSWYHEGWAERYDPKQSTFSQVFDKILGHDIVEDGVVFCVLAAGERFRNHSKNLIDSFLQKVEEGILLVVFTDKIEDYLNYGSRVIFRHIDVPCTECAFHYGLKYKVIQETHRLFDKLNKIFYLDADCFFANPISKNDFSEAVPGLNISLGNLSSEVVNPAIIVKYKMITNHVLPNLNPSKIVVPTRQFRECAMIFHVGDKHIFNKFLSEWQLLYEFTDANKLAYSGEYVEITYACIRSSYPIVNTQGSMSFKNLRDNVHTIILNNPTQAIF
jgi:hypothetical protein